MAFLDQAIDLSTLPQSEQSYELLPPGWYSASITKAELKATKDGTGQYIAIRYDITGPTQQGRVVFGNLNIKNRSVKAEEIGRQQLGELMRAIGLARVQDTDQLIGGQLSIKVAIQEGNNGYEARNEVKGYKALAGGMPPTVPSPFASAPQQPAQPRPAVQASAPAPAAASTPPWAMNR